MDRTVSSFKASTLRSFIAIAVSLAAGLAIISTAPDARAQGKAEGPAKALQKKAMEEDYLMTDFAKAAEKLEKALAQCGTDKCSAQLRSRLKRDLGVVQIGGAIDKDKGLANFVEAIKLDPTVALDPDIKTKDLEQAFAEAKKKASGGAAAPSNGGGAGPAPTPGPAPVAGQPEGDFVHTPAAEQQVRTPIPVYLEYTGEEQLVRVIARYKGFGMAEWKPVELNKMGENGWGGLLPCRDVQQGTTLYYLQGFDANNDPVATGGDRSKPYRVPVKTEAVAEPPHLPNASPPTQCADTGDCPPGFPGCKAATGPGGGKKVEEPIGKDGGEFCEEDSECKSNRCTSDNKCAEYEGPKKGPKLWIGISGALDYTFVPSADDVCKLTAQATPMNDSNYYCTRSDGSDYPSRDPSKAVENNSIVLSKDRGSDKVTGGGALGNVRLMLTLDYAVHPNVMVGGRLGLVLNSYSGAEAEVDGKRFAVPVHLELRTTYVHGENALFKTGFAPYVFGGFGIGQFETGIPVQVIETPPGEAPTKRDVDAWHIAGPAFISVGGGGRYAVTQRFAFMFGLRANLAFLNAFAPSVGPEIGGQIGF
ncbi:MAG: hypothetical protein BGO98_40875 [Myxococcales bacterium 68-20]|nr:MAG: hypothetical protein BGO98_40875 [Myxococcales bacterium 68-20]